MQYTIKPLTENNMQDLYALYQNVYGKSLSQGYLEKKFDAAYLQKEYYGYFAYDDEKPIAFYGGIPVMMRYENQTEMAVQAVNLMTHPSYRGKGLFTILVKQMQLQLQNEGFAFIYGFPNQNSEYGFLNKLNWNYSERMIGYSIKVSRFSIEKVASKTSFSATLYKKYCNWVFNPYKVDQILQAKTIMPDHAVTVDRSEDYYNYKLSLGSFVIALDGCLFWVKIQNGLYLGDVEATSEKQFNKGIQRLKQLCSTAGISEIIVQTSPNTQLDLWMQNLPWQSFDSWIVGYMNFNSRFALEHLKFTLADVDIF